MRCPYCRTDDSRVVDSRTAEDGIRRRRECLSCGARFTTYERVESSVVFVVKRDGRREGFAREKLLGGVRRACEKRPLEAGAIEALVAEVEHEVFARGMAELPSTFIGELIMDRLKVLDQIAYVRFASVYRQFTDLESLREVLDDLEDARRRVAPVNQLPLIDVEPRDAEQTRIVPLPRPRWQGRKRVQGNGSASTR